MNRGDLATALSHPNVFAFLALIREGETNQTDGAYRTMVGGALFDVPPWEHPRRVIQAGRLPPSSAAGAYQFLRATWDELAARYGFPDFSPACQDEAAVALIVRAGALEDVKAGRIREAIARCSRTWASLPGSPYGQPTAKLERLLAAYTQAGGAFADQPATQTETKVKPMGAALLAFLPQLLPLIPALGNLFSSGSEVAQRNVAAATVVGDALVKATQAINVQDAVEKIQSDPDALNAAREAVHELLPQLMDGGGGGVKAAREFAADHENSRYGRILEVVTYAALFFLLLANGIAFAIGWYKEDWGRMEAVTQADIGVALMAFSFFLGSSLSSKRKDEARGAQ